MTRRPFPFEHPVAVRFKDIDVGGHAHHSHALVYFEEARAAWWTSVVGREGLDAVDYILAEASVRYHARVLWPQELRVGVRLARLTRSSFDLEYEVRSEQGELLVSGRTAQVMYDYARGAVKRMPVEVREVMEALDAPVGGEGRPAGEEGTQSL